MSGFKWAEEENSYLRSAVADSTAAQLAEHLGRTVKAVRAQCSVLGIKPSDGRAQRSLDVVVGQQFGRLTVLKVDHYLNRKAAWVSCSGPHEPVEKWVQVSSLAGGRVLSCGCLRSEQASQLLHERNTSDAPPRLGTGQKGLPPGVKYTPKGPKWKYDDTGRECAYEGEGSCGHAFKVWSEFNKGNGAWGHTPWCKPCQAVHHQSRPQADRRDYNLEVRLRAFGMTIEQYRAMEAVHDGRCWLCGEFETMTNQDGSPRRLVIDHAHSCCDFDPTPQHPLCGDCIRGLCCMGCNRRVLGNVDSVGAEKVFSYLGTAQAVAQAILARHPLLESDVKSGGQEVVGRAIEPSIQDPFTGETTARFVID